MKKGTNPAQILRVICKIKDKHPSIDFNSTIFKSKVVDEYNRIYGISSVDTMISILREDAIIHFQDQLKLFRLPQDNNKVDIMGVKQENGMIKIVISQQKGNNASFNSTSHQKTLEKLRSFYDNKLVETYFYLLPDHLNPIKVKLPYSLDIVVGMTIANGDDSILDSDRNIILSSNGNYLKKMGIVKHDMVDIDYWVINHKKIKDHTYDAVSKCYDFDYIYEKCINKLITNGY